MIQSENLQSTRMSANNASAFRKVINAEQYWVGKHKLQASDVVNSSTVTGTTVEDALDYISSSGVGPVLNLNGLTAATQTMTTGTAAGAGNDFNITTSGLSTHVFNMPSASATVRGVVTTGVQTFAGAKTFSGIVTLSAAPVLSTGTITVGAGTVTVPAVTDTLVGKATTDTLTNKTLTAPVIATIVNTGTLTLPTSTDTLVGRATTDTLTNKSLVDATTYIIDDGSSTKIAQFDCSALTAGATKTYTFPDVSMTFVGQDNSQTLTTKIMTGATNIITARYLKTATTEVDVFTGAAPSLGQVLTATGASAATWQTPAAGGATTLATLTDCTISGTAEQDLLSWNAGTSRWNNRTIANALKGAGTTSICIGASSSTSGTTGTNSIVIGTSAGSASMSTDNIAIGRDALDGTSSAVTECVAIGVLALSGACTQSYTVAIGSNALTSLTSGQQCVAVGYGSGSSASSGSNNTFLGHSAGYSITTTGNNTFVGCIANSAVGSASTTCVGHNSVASGSSAVVIGASATCAASGTASSVVIGAAAYNTNANSVVVGYNARAYGSGAVSVGASAGFASSSATSGTFVGFEAGKAVTSGTSNCFVGYQAGNATVTTGANNTLVGASTVLDAAARSGCVVLGKGAASTADNQLVISTNNGANANTIRTTLACTAKGASTGANPADTDYLTVSVNIGGTFQTRYIPLYTTA